MTGTAVDVTWGQGPPRNEGSLPNGDEEANNEPTGTRNL